jgi:hypothetical protein
MTRALVLVVALALSGAAACSSVPSAGPDAAVPPDGGGADADAGPDAGTGEPRCLAHDPLRRAYFGDTHIHTALSLDANLQGTRLTPTDAYRFARGEAVGIQPHDAAGNPLRTVQLARPLDFAMVSDHAEFLGTVRVCQTPGAPGYDDPQCRRYRNQPDQAFMILNALLGQAQGTARPPSLCGATDQNCEGPARSVWQEVQDAAAAALDATPACSFTSFVGYEWSGSPGLYNLHRNVVFAGAAVPERPTSYFESSTPDGLWAALRSGCLEAGTGCDVLTIPHNSNLSNGLMFETPDGAGAARDAAYLAERAAMEPLVEIFQHKGDSECQPGTTAGDELCDFEKFPFNSLSSAAVGAAGTADGGLPQPTDFVRQALGLGLQFEKSRGVNPYRYGIIASTDTHLGTPGLVDESNYPGHGGAGAASRSAVPPGLPDHVWFNPGGLAVLWAEQNSRGALFAAMRRREAYGTSGPRILLRFFAGTGYPDGLCSASDLVAKGYASGVPMGGELTASIDGEPPRFVVSAVRDAGVAGQPGGLLQRAQIVKGWLDGDTVRFAVHDVAGGTGGSVDLGTCQPDGVGQDTLCSVWSDPAFDPRQPAFYYARVLEAPSCRWTSRQCLAAGVNCQDPATVTSGFEGCCDTRFPRTVQERAWSSPIFVHPG